VTLKRSFVAIMAALALLSASNASALAQATNTATLTATLNAGALSFTIQVTSQLSPQSYTHDTGYTSASGGAFTVVVSDDRNTNAGYSINLAASNFTRTTGTGTIVLGADGTRLAVPTAGAVTRQAGDFTNLPVARTATNLTTTAVPILTAVAGSGNGRYTAAGYALTLTGVLASVPTGEYTSTLTLSASAAPTS
jgi:hypothetical protein